TTTAAVLARETLSAIQAKPIVCSSSPTAITGRRAVRLVEAEPLLWLRLELPRGVDGADDRQGFRRLPADGIELYVDLPRLPERLELDVHGRCRRKVAAYLGRLCLGDLSAGLR